MQRIGVVTGREAVWKNEYGIWPLWALTGACERPKWPLSHHSTGIFRKHMQSCSIQNGREAVAKNEKGHTIRQWPIDFDVARDTVLERTHLLYWDTQRAFLWKFRFGTVVAMMRTANLCAKQLGKAFPQKFTLASELERTI
jgi:hypothetical protein